MRNDYVSSASNNIGLSPIISVRASPAHVNVTFSSAFAAAPTVSIGFELRGSRPVTIFNYNTLLSPLIHYDFSFRDTISGARYKPSIVERQMVIPDSLWAISYTNAHNFITLYPNTPYTVDCKLWPKADDGNSHTYLQNMEPGRTYRMSSKESDRKQHLWWMWGRKWQVLRWRWWPFGKVKDVYDFVCLHKRKDEVGQVEFVWEGDCVVHVTE